MSEQPTRPTAMTPAPGDASDPEVPAGTRPTAENPAPAPTGGSRRGAADPTAVNGPLENGTVIAQRYKLVAPLASGGMATVWQAVDEVLTRPVAVKILHAHLAADPEFVARFRREAVAAARLAHPSIVAIYDTCADPEAIVMELVEGRTLRAELDTRGFLPPGEAAEIASGIAQALDVAHRAGIVHRDVKPANVLLSGDGRVKVADFGIAKAARADDEDGDPDLPDLTRVGHMVGTAKYLAPEQVSGAHVDARTDVYALGCVLYEMLCGRAPFSADNDLATAVARLHGPPERPRSVLRTVPDRLDAIVMRCLATEPDRRYSSASALWADLQAAPVDSEIGGSVGSGDPGVDTTTVGDAPSFAKAERSWLVPAMLVTLVAVALGLAWLLIGGTEAGRDFFDLVDRVAPGGDDGVAADAQPVAGLVATAFDPQGTGGEYDDEAALAVDGDPATAWRTERYDTRAFGGLKDGVGIHVDLGAGLDLGELVVQSSSPGWSATVYVADSPGASLDDWGDPVATVDGAEAGETSIDISGASGEFVLLWLTDVGSAGGFRFELQDLRVTAS